MILEGKVRKTALQLKKTVEPEGGSFVAVSHLSRLAEDWLADCQIRQHSPRTIESRHILLGRLKRSALSAQIS